MLYLLIEKSMLALKRSDEELKKINVENIRLLNEKIAYDKLKTEFFTNMSHEFRTPLNVLLGSLQLLESYSSKDGSIQGEKLSKHTDIMKQNCYRLLKLVNNLIDITQIDSGHLKQRLQNSNIVEIVEEVTMSVKEFIEKRSITLTFDTDVEEKIISCDIYMVERIILNLLSNATKFNKPGGSIYVQIRGLDDSAVVSVKDTGIGIPEDKVNVIFDRFRQVNSSLIRDHEGSGIGLSLAKSFVEMHGGSIWVESELGKGSEFNIRFPAVLESHNSDTPIVCGKDRSYLYMTSIEFSDI
jgi:signal transduction histidine kinase